MRRGIKFHSFCSACSRTFPTLLSPSSHAVPKPGKGLTLDCSRVRRPPAKHQADFFSRLATFTQEICPMTAPTSPSFSDVASRMRKKAEENATPPRDFNELYIVRARILGILIRDGRLIKGLSEEQCAEELEVSPDTFRAWELGEQSPTLPQLEMLAFFLGVPVSHFWETKTITAQPQSRTIPQETFLELRDRVIGAQLRLARQEMRL